jgi:hypothetical protein
MSRTLKFLCVLYFLSGVSAYAQMCSGEIVFTNPKTNASSTDVINLNLFSTVSRGSCMPAQIHLNATFYDAEENFICSGTIESFTVQSSNVLTTNLELRPINVQEFVRLKAPKRPLAKRLFCMNVEGNIEVQVTEIAAAASLRLRATILPANGGVATTETRITLNNIR